MNRSSGPICDQNRPLDAASSASLPPFCLVRLAVHSAPTHTLDLGCAVIADKAGVGSFFSVNRPARREQRECIPVLHSVWIEYALTMGGTK